MSKVSDALVTANDFITIHNAIGQGDYKRLVYEMIAREPEIAFGISARFDRLLTHIASLNITDEQRDSLTKQMSLLVCSPVLALERAHRRAWESFLPSIEDGDDESEMAEGGAE